MKYIKLLTILLLSSTALASNETNCAFEVRGYDCSEVIAGLFEDSLYDVKIDTTPEACDITAISTMKKKIVIQYQVKGKTFACSARQVYVKIKINGDHLPIDRLNYIATGNSCLSIDRAFEFNSNPTVARFDLNTDC